MTESERLAKHPGQFATTQWSMIAMAGQLSSQDARSALKRLCQTYWQPLYAFACRKANSLEDAQDLTQAFFVELLEKNFVATAQPQRGRFRSFLLTAFKNFMSKEWKKGRALKRGGNQIHLSFNFENANSSINIQPESGLTAEQLFDQQWALSLLEQILLRLKNEYTQSGNEARFECLKDLVIGDHSGKTYRQAAEDLQISEDAVKKTVSRMRTRYREIFRDEIAQTVSQTDEIDDEIRRLFKVFQPN